MVSLFLGGFQSQNYVKGWVYSKTHYIIEMKWVTIAHCHEYTVKNDIFSYFYLILIDPNKTFYYFLKFLIVSTWNCILPPILFH